MLSVPAEVYMTGTVVHSCRDIAVFFRFANLADVRWRSDGVYPDGYRIPSRLLPVANELLARVLPLEVRSLKVRSGTNQGTRILQVQLMDDPSLLLRPLLLQQLHILGNRSLCSVRGARTHARHTQRDSHPGEKPDYGRVQ